MYATRNLVGHQTNPIKQFSDVTEFPYSGIACGRKHSHFLSHALRNKCSHKHTNVLLFPCLFNVYILTHMALKVCFTHHKQSIQRETALFLTS